MEPSDAVNQSETNQGTLTSDRIVCNGCKQTLEENGMANDSVVVSFGNSLWHVDCFRCAKCRNLVEHDTNLLLLSDGSPVCENCSYICSVCKQPISNEAIVTGEESYHADCFRCRSCSNRIEELIFAKTSQGIYCMTCHNQRVTRSRRHAEAKRNKASNAQSSQKQKDRDRDRKPRPSPAHQSPPGLPPSQLPPDPPYNPSVNHLRQTSTSNVALSSAKPLLGSVSQPSLDPKLSATSLASSSHNPRSPGSIDSTHQPHPSTSSDIGHRPLQSKHSSPINFLGFRRRGGSASSVHLPPTHPSAGPNAPHANPDLSKPRPGPSTATRPSTADGNRSQSSSPHPQLNSAAINRSYESSPHLATAPDPSAKSSSPQKSFHRFHPQKSKLLDIAPDISAFKSKLKHRSASLDSFGNINAQPVACTQVDLNSDAHRITNASTNPYGDVFSALDHNSNSPMLSSSFLDDPRRSRNQYDIENLLPSYASNDTYDQLVTSASRRAQNGDSAHPPNADTHDLGLDVELVEKLLWELDSTKEKMKALQEEYHHIGRATSNTLEGSISSTKKQLTSLKREEAESKMRELKMLMSEQASRLKAVDSCLPLEHQSEKLQGSVFGLQNHLRQLTTERDVRVAEIETLNDLRDQLKKDGKISQPMDQALIAKFQHIRDQYLGEIQELASERDQLKGEVTHLNKVRESQAKELDSLNQRFDALSEMNAEAVKRLEETRSSTTRIQGRSSGPANAKNMLISPTAALNANEPELSPEVNIATTRKFKWGKSHAQKTSSPAANVRNNNHPTQNTGISGNSGADLTSTNNNDVITITNSQNLGINDGNSQTNNGNNSANINNLNSMNNNSSSNLTAASHHSGSNNHGIGVNSGNNTTVINTSSLSSAQQHPQQTQQAPTTNSNPNPMSNMRPHTFQPVSALRPVRCDYCGDKLWGLAEVRCTSCGSYSHTKCAANFFGCPASTSGNSNHATMTSLGLTVTNNSQSSNNEDEADSVLFGNDLVLQAKQENKLVPSVVIKCIEAVERHGLKFEGIYRKTGGMSSVKMIQNCFEKGTSMNFDDLDKFNDISAITSTLKNYFRQLPNPLFTFELHEAFVTVASMAPEAIRLDALERVIYQLPMVHFETLKMLMTHLSNIEKLSEFNKMNSQNLGVIFGPTLLRSSNPNRQFSDMPFTAKIVELTVLNKHQLFRKPYGPNTNASTNPNASNLSSSNSNSHQQSSSTTNTNSNAQSNLTTGFSPKALTTNSLSNPSTMSITNFLSSIDPNSTNHLQASNQFL